MYHDEPGCCAGLVTSGQLVPALSFVTRHPEALGSMFALSMAATLGALTCFCSSLLSCHSGLDSALLHCDMCISLLTGTPLR